MKNLITFIFMLIILVINSTILFADQPVLKEAVRITEMKIIGEPLKDEKVILSVEYVSFVSIEASIKLIFSNNIKPSNYFGEENFVEEIQRMNENQSYRKEFELEVKDIGNSIITFAIRTEELEGFNNGISRYLSFEINESDYSIYDERSDIIKTQPLTINTQRGTKGQETDALYTVSVNGNVYFYDSHQFTNKGLYGNTVEIWFRNSNNPNNWYHPVYSSNCTGSQNVHYDIVDVNGNYNFNFSFNGNLSSYNQVLVIVSRDNSSARMPVQQNGITTWCDNSYRNWFSLSESFIGNINGSNTNITVNNANCVVNSPDGEIFRNMMFAREFVIQRYNGSLTFSLPNIYVLRTSLLPEAAGRFISSGSGVIPRIEIDHNLPELTTTSHEYGHFVNYKMWGDFLIGSNGCSDELGNTVPGAGKIYKEGWAINYSFCTRNYANKVYGDSLRFGDDNTETAAYQTPRFKNIRYTSVDPNISAFACYLWNLYDDYNNGNFESSVFLGDNDDISGRSVRVFETMRTPIMDCASKFNNKFKIGLTSEEQTSVQDIYTFMFLNANHNHRSAQVSNTSAQVISSNQIQFQWSSRSYPNNSYRNYESGYRIYKKVDNVWQLIYTALAGSTNYTYQTTQTYGDFKITSYNQTGDSYNPAILNVPLVAPIISNFTQSPVPICKGSSGYVQVNLSQGNGQLTYN